MKRKIKFVLFVFVFLLIGFYLILTAYGWFLKKQARVLVGTARPEFPYSDYSQEELNKLYPQYIENNVPTAQSPEQTHAKFLAALKKGDFDEAVNCCFREGDRSAMKDGLNKIQQMGELKNMINELDSTITKENENDWESTYSYSVLKDGKKFGHTIIFIKDSKGIWYIESL